MGICFFVLFFHKGILPVCLLSPFCADACRRQASNRAFLLRQCRHECLFAPGCIRFHLLFRSCTDAYTPFIKGSSSLPENEKISHDDTV